MIITKEKLPKGSTYPLRSSFLENALEAAGVTIPVSLRYAADSELLLARYVLPATWEDYESINIESGAVSSRNSMEAKEFLESTIVPEFILWVDEHLKLPENSSRFTGHLFLKWTCQKIMYSRTKEN